METLSQWFQVSNLEYEISTKTQENWDFDRFQSKYMMIFEIKGSNFHNEFFKPCVPPQKKLKTNNYKNE